MKELNKYIDHTKLGTSVMASDIDKLVSEAISNHFKSVCVNPVWVKYVEEKLRDTECLVCTVVGFPDGAHTLKVKKYETKQALKDGADEIDMVINVSDLKNGHPERVLEEIKTLKKVCKNKVLKVIIETCYLTPEEIELASKLCVEARADFVKTSTGFGTYGARLEDVKLIKKAVTEHINSNPKFKGFEIGIKASGGVSSKEDALKFIEAGATRIGTSKGLLIVKGE